ncbi:regucalcin isoform X3 [Bactrocera dorsalis]|uniref:Regucalcin isoform X3 n=1 Tax=Bactrocera dorsalis TaxID=27457 RepID=A0A6I9VDM2_BACDO|nr:regucalcin isoform X3 [Bactrocera dorsalis]XP_049306711.1 regucalcin isoform X3 [Bactrocera dorsalis]
MSHKVEQLPDSYAYLGEGPHWDIETQSLYFVDIKGGKLLRYDYKENKTYGAKVENEEHTSFVIPVQGEIGKFAVGCGCRVVIVAWDGAAPVAKVERIAYTLQQGDEVCKHRFNDGKADPRGRLLVGSMYLEHNVKKPFGELYRLEKGQPMAVVRSGLTISNGLTWNERTNKFYFIDSYDHEVTEYDYDLDTGVTSNPKVVFKHAEHMPDGMTIDTEGNIYVATFNGHTVYKINPSTQEVLLAIKLPTKQITSVAFGGPNLDILYVTTAEYVDQPAPAGFTFKVTGLGAKGLPMRKVTI